MTLTITARRTAFFLLAVLSLTVVYVIGATHSRGAPAAGSTFTAAESTSLLKASSNLSSPMQAFAISAIGGPGITVGGRANVSGTPDTLRLALSVAATGSTVSEALASANRSADAVQTSLLAHGVAKKDLQTAGLNIAPDYDYSKGGPARLRGYQVSESVSAQLRDLGRAGDAIGKAVTAGGDAVRVNGISLDLEDTGPLVSSARGKAFGDAKAKAGQYAKAAGRGLGDVVSISEDVLPPSPIAMPYAALASAAAFDKASVPIQAGSQNITVSVKVVFSMS